MKFKKVLVPALTSLSIVLICATAIFIRVYQVYGYYPSASEIFFSSPICYFWILWYALFYFAANGIIKEYHGAIDMAKIEYPLIPDNEIKKYAQMEILHRYSKRLIFLFLGLPLSIAFVFPEDFVVSIKSILILLIPFIVNLLVYCFLMVYIKNYTNEKLLRNE